MREDEKRSRRFAKELRGRMTEAETILWSQLRLRRVHGRSFRRQHPIGPFIADFACVAAKLVIELDGGETHGPTERAAYDRRRDAILESRGWRVIRIRNIEIFQDLSAVLDMIFDQAPPPSRR